MINLCLQSVNIEVEMTSKIVSVRINTEIYLRLQAIAADRGVSVGQYLRHKLESEDQALINDVKLMQSDIRDILHILSSGASAGSNNKFDSNAMLLEILLLLREIVQPNKLSAAHRKLQSLNVSVVNTLGVDNE